MSPSLAAGNCYCSGMSAPCGPVSEPHYWSTLRVSPGPGDSWEVAARGGQVSRYYIYGDIYSIYTAQDLGVSPVFDGGTGELTYQHQPGGDTVHYWTLPQQFLGQGQVISMSIQ